MTDSMVMQLESMTSLNSKEAIQPMVRQPEVKLLPGQNKPVLLGQNTEISKSQPTLDTASLA